MVLNTGGELNNRKGRGGGGGGGGRKITKDYCIPE